MANLSSIASYISHRELYSSRSLLAESISDENLVRMVHLQTTPYPHSQPIRSIHIYRTVTDIYNPTPISRRKRKDISLEDKTAKWNRWRACGSNFTRGVSVQFSCAGEIQGRSRAFCHFSDMYNAR